MNQAAPLLEKGKLKNYATITLTVCTMQIVPILQTGRVNLMSI